MLIAAKICSSEELAFKESSDDFSAADSSKLMLVFSSLMTSVGKLQE
jgi:hypothetical protein